MRKLFIVVMFMFVAVSSRASWIEDNSPPQRVLHVEDGAPSIGVFTEMSNIGGSVTEQDGPDYLRRVYHGGRDIDSESVGVDLRLPVHRSMVFETEYKKIWMTDEFSRAGGNYRRSDNMDGYSVKFGLRIYFHD